MRQMSEGERQGAEGVGEPELERILIEEKEVRKKEIKLP